MSFNTDYSIEERVRLAVDNFMSGYNCAQSVFLAYADLADVERELAGKISLSFGGGMGRMREVCGTVTAMSMLAGLRYPVSDPKNMEDRTHNYAKVQELAKSFKQLNNSIICRELLSAKEATKTDPEPSQRTYTYYKERPCSKYVADAAYIIGKLFKEDYSDPSAE